jgi:hypothetical protein
MKTAFAILALCAFTQSALAGGPDCRAVTSTSARLACYDAASPPKPEKPAKLEKPANVEHDASRAEYDNLFAEEEARTSAS